VDQVEGQRDGGVREAVMTKTLLGLVSLGAGLACGLATAADPPLKVLLVTGGHDFQTNQFLAMFAADPGVSVRQVNHPRAHEWFRAARASEYDVMVFYDMWQEIGPEARRDLLERVREGKGLVALHHALASYQDWDDYARLIGGRYHLAKRIENGVEIPGSTYLHDVTFQVRIAAPDHPVTRGIRDFTIHDETYGGFEVKAGVTPLLETDEQTSGPILAWARQEVRGRVVYLQLGHDHHAYEHPAFRQLVAQAIRWVAAKP
jgi:uncharacterized protein